MTDQGHVYHLLGQSPLPQRNEEGSPLRPETTETTEQHFSSF